MIVRPLSTVDNTRDYARVSHSRQWSNYNIHYASFSVASPRNKFASSPSTGNYGETCLMDFDH